MKSIWQTISKTGLTGTETTQERRLIYLVNRIILLACIFTPAFIPFFIFTGNTFSTISQSTYSLIFPFFFILSKKHKFQLALLLAYYTALSNIMFASVANYNIGSEYLLLPLGLIPFMALREMRTSIIVFCSTLVAFLILQVLKTTISPYIIMQENNRLFLFHSVLVMCFIITLAIMYNFKSVMAHYESSILKQKADIEEQKQIIEEKQKELVDSIRYARRIQQALLPSQKYIDRTFSALNKK